LVSLLPPRPAYALARLEPYGFFIVMALVLTGALSNLWLWPLITVGQAAIRLLLFPVFWLVS